MAKKPIFDPNKGVGRATRTQVTQQAMADTAKAAKITNPPGGIRVQEMFDNNYQQRAAARAAAKPVAPAPVAPAAGTAANPIKAPTPTATSAPTPVQTKYGVRQPMAAPAAKATGLRGLLAGAGRALSSPLGVGIGMALHSEELGGDLPDWIKKGYKSQGAYDAAQASGAQPAAKPAAAPAAQPAKPAAPVAQAFNAMQPAGTGSDGRTQIGDMTVANSELESKTGAKLVADGILRKGNAFTNLVDGQRIGAPAVPGQKDNVVDMMERVAARDAAVNSQAPVVAVMGGGSASQSSGSGLVDYFREAGQRKQQRAQELQAQQDTAAMQRQQAGDATQREVAAANNQQSLFRQLLSDEAAQRRAETEAQGKQELSVSDMLAISRERRDQANQYQSQNIDTLKGLFASEADPKGEAGYAQNRGRFDATAVQLGWGTNATELNPAQLQNLATARQLEQKIAGQGWLARGQAPAASADYTAYLPAQATGGKGGYSIDPANPEMVVGRDASGRVVWSATRQAVQTQDPNMLQSLFNLGPLRNSSVDQRFN